MLNALVATLVGDNGALLRSQQVASRDQLTASVACCRQTRRVRNARNLFAPRRFLMAQFLARLIVMINVHDVYKRFSRFRGIYHNFNNRSSTCTAGNHYSACRHHAHTCPE